MASAEKDDDGISKFFVLNEAFYQVKPGVDGFE